MLYTGIMDNYANLLKLTDPIQALVILQYWVESDEWVDRFRYNNKDVYTEDGRYTIRSQLKLRDMQGLPGNIDHMPGFRYGDFL